MRTLPSAIAIGLMAFTTLPARAEFDLTLESAIAYDSNPFRLNESLFSIQADTYVHSELDAALALGNVTLDAKVSDRRYQDDSRADSQKIDVDVAYTMAASKATDVVLGVDYDSFDKTFVSRFSGQTFSARGVSAENRYDYSRIMPFVELEHTLSKKHRLTATVEYRQQDYEDYTALGLTDLDYSQSNLTLAWRYRPNAQWQVTPEIAVGKRQFDNRLAKDANGNDIVNSDLEYDYAAASIAVRYAISKATKLTVETGVAERSDSGGGYFDTEATTFSVRVKHKHARYMASSVKLSLNDLDYNRAVQGDVEANNEAPSRSGWKIQFSHERPIVTWAGKPLVLKLKAEAEDYRADLTQYQYDRYRVAAGLEYRF